MIPHAPFGRTGHASSRTIFGGAALGSATQAEADDVLDLLLRHGIDHIDTAASYGDSELRIAPWLREHRERFFVATKTDRRDYAGARDQIRLSLGRLGVDHVDLIQLHNLVAEDEWTRAFAPDGALRAVVEARDAGLARFIGVTGHGVRAAEMHRRSLERFPFDAVLFPYNFVQTRDAAYARDVEALVALCEARGVAMQTIKSITAAPWGDREHTTTTWYEPLTAQEDIDLAVAWVLGRPGLFLNTVSDTKLLRKVLDAAERPRRRPSDAEMDALLTRRGMAPLFV